MEKTYNPGQKYLRHDSSNVDINFPQGYTFLIILISAEPQSCYENDNPVWRCLSFMSLTDGSLQDGQIVLYAEHELDRMAKMDRLRLNDASPAPTSVAFSPIPEDRSIKNTSESETGSILTKIQTLKDNAARQGIFLNAITLKKNDYLDLIETPAVFEMRKLLELGIDAKDHIMWDGVKIKNKAHNKEPSIMTNLTEYKKMKSLMCHIIDKLYLEYS